MSIVLVTGSAGLIGSATAEYFAGLGMDVVGIDNDMRQVFFGEDASTAWNRRRIERELKRRYTHETMDIRDAAAIDALFRRLGGDISLVVHAAAQPSHDWAARNPPMDFAINAGGTLNLLEATRHWSPDAVFIFTSTNKVYGDTPNRLPLIELETRWEIDAGHEYAQGIREDMSVDQTLHSVFGASKTAADLMVQEYGRYFGLRTACFRGGCLTGPNHSGAELHGFLAYLVRCVTSGLPYTIHGYQGKQVRDNIHSSDLVRAFHQVFLAPRSGEVYNIGGGRFSNCSVLEAIELSQEIAGRELRWSYSPESRVGDHIWWVSSNSRFQSHYPAWRQEYDIPRILAEIHDACAERLRPELAVAVPAGR